MYMRFPEAQQLRRREEGRESVEKRPDVKERRLLIATSDCEQAFYNRAMLRVGMRGMKDQWLVMTASMHDVFREQEVLPVEMLRGLEIEGTSIPVEMRKLLALSEREFDGIEMGKAVVLLRSFSIFGQNINSIVGRIPNEVEREGIRDSLLKTEGKVSIYGMIKQLADRVYSYCEAKQKPVPREVLMWELDGEDYRATLPVRDAFTDGFENVRYLLQTNHLTRERLDPVSMSVGPSKELLHHIDDAIAISKESKSTEVVQALEHVKEWIEGTIANITGTEEKERETFYTDLFSNAVERKAVFMALQTVKEGLPEVFLQTLGMNTAHGQQKNPYYGNVIQRALRLRIDSAEIDPDLTGVLEHTPALQSYDKVLFEESMNDARSYFGGLVELVQKYRKLAVMVNTMLMITTPGKAMLEFRKCNQEVEERRHLKLFKTGKYTDLSAEHIVSLYEQYGENREMVGYIAGHRNFPQELLTELIKQQNRLKEPDVELLGSILNNPSISEQTIQSILNTKKIEKHINTIITTALQQKEVNPLFITVVLGMLSVANDKGKIDLNSGYIVQLLRNNPTVSALPDFIKQIDSIDPNKAVEKMVERKADESEVKRLIAQCRGLSSATAELLIAGGYVQQVVESLVEKPESFEKVLSAKVTEAFVHKWYYVCLACNVERFTSVDHNAIAQGLVSADNLDDQEKGRYMEKLRGLTSDTAEVFINKGYSNLIVENWGKFDRLDPQWCAERMIQKKKGDIVLENWGKYFKTVDKQWCAEQLIANDQYDLFEKAEGKKIFGEIQKMD